MSRIKLPKKLKTDLILSAVFELRFSTKIPQEAVYGMVYQAVIKKYPSVSPVRLPITQLPDVVRNFDPNLIFQPYNILNIDTKGIGIGSRVINFSIQKPYIGWDQWSSFIAEFIPEFVQLGIFDNIERTGLRFANFTEQNLCSIAQMDVQIGSTKLGCQPMTLRTEIQEGDYIKVLHLVNNAVVEVRPLERLNGSVIDIEIIKKIDMPSAKFQEQFETILEESHQLEKRLFFEIIKDEFLTTLEPDY
ncbi:MAG: TIGR04255 family protein [Planctomycetaceae bacterium]|jgi:uncharacterized protein (TIGR04255 family)|nr:TIGR04255 family protein [Planctomycetaceae bacterium]